MATRPKAVIESRNGEKFSPITITKNVLIDDGQNLHDILSDRKEDTMTPTIENSSSMFKVGQGDNVDYSENVVDGAYESCVFKGKSLVNLSNLHRSFEDATLSGYYCDTSLCETSKLKLGTPYTLVFYTTVHGGDHDIYSGFELGVSDMLHATNAHPKTTTDYWGTLVKNGWSKMCVTFTDFLGYKYLSLRPVRCHAPESGKSIRFSIEGFILLEGDWSNKDLPFNDYFTGLCDVKMPILHNVGKNLFDISTWKSDRDLQLINNGDGYTITGARGWFVIPVKVGEKYSLTYKGNNSANSDYALELYETNNSNSTPYGEWDLLAVNRFKTPNSVSEISSFTYIAKKKYLIAFHGSSERQLNLYDLQLEESSMATTYEDHKTNILRTSEEIVLREVNGVQDTYNPLTGEYVQRIGEIVFDGEFNLLAQSCEDVQYYRVGTGTINNFKLNSCIINDMLPVAKKVTSDTKGEFVGDHTNSESIHIRLLSSKLSQRSVDGVQEYLRANPITVQYELETPIIAKVDVQGFPYAYKDGHVQLSSGSIEQSLTPKVEYSVVTNRNGQIRSNQKMVERHQKQLDRLQAMILTNLVNTQYEQTLTNLKYDLKNVREEVK